jgi:glycosyltransferase involved in cell wall biosynthesis
MIRIVLVNATSLASGGGLTILHQFVDNLDIQAEDDAMYYIFVPDTCKSSNKRENIVYIRNLDNKFYKSRDHWNLRGMKKWCKANKIWPDELYSMQNYFPFGFKRDVKLKTLYLHQPIPFFENKWSLFKKDERILWFYKNIYYYLIKEGVKEADKVIVQTEWLKKRVVETLGCNRDKVVVERPTIKNINAEAYKPIEGLKGMLRLFYPASEVIYKNHEVLYKAMDIIVNHHEIDDVVLYLTLDQHSPVALKYMNEFKLQKNVVLTGALNFQQVMEYYKSVNALVFPSKIETFGLPLVEAQQFKLPIIASDMDLYREVIGKYEGSAVYCGSGDAREWAKAIMEQRQARI